MSQIKTFNSEYSGNKNPVPVYYFLVFLENLAFGLHASIYVLFLLSQNLNLFQVNVVNFVFMMGCFLFELPTGAFADLYGRKKSLVLGYLLFSFAFYLYFISNSFVMFVLAEAIGAIAFTFISGAQEAWIVDEVKKSTSTKRIDLVFSHGHIISRFAGLLSGLIGAYIGVLSLRIPMLLTAIMLFLTAVYVLFVVKERFIKPEKVQGITRARSLIVTAKEGVKYASFHKVILMILITSFLTNFAFQAPNMYWSPRFNDLAGNQIWIVGWIWAGMSLSMMTGSYVIRYFINRDKSYTQISIIAILLIGVPLLLSALSNIFSIVLIGFLMHEIGRGMHQPIQKSYLNSFLSHSHRATIFSFDSMIGKLGAGTGLLVLGIIAHTISIQFSWIVSSVIILLTIALYVIAGKKQ